MHEVIYPMIYWPIGIAIGGWLFFRDRETHIDEIPLLQVLKH